MRRVGIAVLPLALLGAAVACGAGRHAAATSVARLRVSQPVVHHGAWVHVSVVDGDRGNPVRGALVRIGRHARVSDRRGIARIHLKRRGNLVVQVQRRGYTPAAQRFQFRNHPLRTVRVYQPKLQWPMYGVVPTRTQVQPHIGLRPPFRIVWSRGMAGLLEFPAVVSDGVAYIGNYWGSIRAVAMGNGAHVWRNDIPHGKMASSPAVYGDELIVDRI